MDEKKPCRLCLDVSEDFVNIFQDFEKSTIVAILSQHFAFQIEDSSDYLCRNCWTNTKDFHIFYKKMTSQQKHLQSKGFVDQQSLDSHVNQAASNITVSIKLEPCLSPLDAMEETNSCIVKTEEMNPAIAFDLPIQTEESFDASYDPSEDDQTTDDEEQSPKPQDEEACESENNKLDNSEESSQRRLIKRFRFRQTKITKNTATEDAQIREFCNMKCEICSHEFGTFPEANQHYRTAHNTAGYLTCCQKKFDKRYRVLEHIQRHLHPEQYKCETCGKVFANKFSFKNHVENHEPRDYKCEICSSSFTRQWKLENHKRKAHCSEEDKKFQCNQCDKKFVSKSILDYHIRYKHELAYAQVCDVCARVCKNKTTLDRHMQQHHSTAFPSELECTVCGVWKQNEKSLRAHLKRHQDPKCTICNKVLQCRRSLSNHMRHVHGEKRYKCSKCEKTYTKAILLREHVAAIHLGEFLYACQYCKKPFKSNSNLHDHRKKFHFEEWSRDRPKRSKC